MFSIYRPYIKEYHIICLFSFLVGDWSTGEWEAGCGQTVATDVQRPEEGPERPEDGDGSLRAEVANSWRGGIG